MSKESYPELCVFDLDGCFWDFDTYVLNAIPTETILGDLNGRGVGVIGVVSTGQELRLHSGSLYALQQHYDGLYGDMRIAFASSAVTTFAEKVGRAALKLLEVVPGVTVWDLVVGRDWKGRDINQIGRHPPLTRCKARSHFPFLKRATGIRYDNMLFYDDCLWEDNCGNVESRCLEPDTKHGPTVVRTPTGLGIEEWNQGLRKYAKHRKSRARGVER